MIPHLRLPFTIRDDGTVPVVDQDTPEEIDQCVATVLGTRPGERQVVGDFGVDSQLLSRQVDAAAIVQSIVQWEPRADPVELERRITSKPPEALVEIFRGSP